MIDREVNNKLHEIKPFSIYNNTTDNGKIKVHKSLSNATLIDFGIPVKNTGCNLVTQLKIYLMWVV